MRSIFIGILAWILFVPLHGYADTAQPGIFRAGGTMNFALLFPEDSNALRKVQMVDEHVAIQLYRGFAVVRGEYKMYNTTDERITIRVGYPVNTQYKATEPHSTATTIFFDQLYALKSYTNGKENLFLIQPGEARLSMAENNWYVWADTFKPKDTTTILVYFIVNTNNAEIIEGYKHDDNNAFIYLLETGATWKQPILKGDIKIQLMDNLKIADIRGLTPASAFQVDEGRNMLVYRFTDLSPTFENNIALVYTPHIDSFEFSYVSQKRMPLFGSIDAFSLQSISELSLADHTFASPYSVRKMKWNSLLNLGLLIGGTILGLIIAVVLIRLLLRTVKGNRPAKGPER